MTAGDPAASPLTPVPPAEPIPTGAVTPPPLAYHSARRAAWPWDIKIVVILSLCWAGLELIQAALAIRPIVGQKSITWFTGNYNGLSYVLGVVLRSLLPLLLVTGLVGFLTFRRGARRLCVLTAWAFVAFGAVEIVTQCLSLLTQFHHELDLPNYILGTVQNAIRENGLMIILAITLMRADVKAMSSG